MSRRLGCVLGVLVILSVDGCSTPIPGFARPVTEISPSEIPAGTYAGEITWAGWVRINGTIVNQGDETESHTTSFDEDGIPLDSTTGGPERPGLSVTTESGGDITTSVTETVVTAGNRVTVTYKNTTKWAEFFPDAGTVTTSGRGSAVYTLRSDGAVEVSLMFRESSGLIDGVGFTSIGGTATGVLTLPGR